MFVFQSRLLSQSMLIRCSGKPNFAPRFRYIICHWATWLLGLCAVPLHHSLPGPSLLYHIRDSQAKLVLVSEDLREKLAGSGIDQENIFVIPDYTEAADYAETKLLVSYSCVAFLLSCSRFAACSCAMSSTDLVSKDLDIRPSISVVE